MQINELKKEMKKLCFVPSKKMGQNFLISKDKIKLILENLKIDFLKDKILEIGPGFGAITSEIFKTKVDFIIIEFDKRINEYLKNFFLNINLIEIDVLKMDLNKFCLEKKINKIVSNLPYSISTKIIIESIQCSNINLFIFMVQKELAERLCSSPNNKNYNSLSVLVQSFFNIQIISRLKPSDFFPQPKIDSAIIKMTSKNLELNFLKFNKFLKICFSHKRKTLVNNVKNNYKKDHILKILKNLNIEKNIRPDKIDILTFQTIFKEIKHAF